MIFRQTPDSKRDQVEREKAKAGNTEVMNILAMIYEQDMGVEADEETVKLWRDANANGVRKEER